MATIASLLTAYVVRGYMREAVKIPPTARRHPTLIRSVICTHQRRDT